MMMVDMALPIHEAEQRRLDTLNKVISISFTREGLESETILPPWTLALDHFLHNGNATYVKNWVRSYIEEVPVNQRVIFLNTLENRADDFFDMLNSMRNVALLSVINEFLTRDWD